MLDQAVKILDQNTKNIERINRVFSKIVFLVNCIALSIWLESRFNYTIITQPISAITIGELFSKHYLVLSLFIYVLVNLSINYSIQIVYFCVMRRVVRQASLHIPPTWLITEFNHELLKSMSFITKSEKDEDALISNRNGEIDELPFTGKIIKALSNHQNESKLIVQTALSLLLVYLFVIRENFPNLFVNWVTIIFVIGVLFKHFSYSVRTAVYDLVIKINMNTRSSKNPTPK